jgi:WD40 repeat protein
MPLLVTSVGFSPDGKVLASAALFGQAIRFWDPATGKEIHPLPGHSGPVESVRFLAGDRELISFGEDRKTLLWDLSTTTERCRLFDAHSLPATGKAWNAFAISPDAKLLAFGKQTVLQAKVDPVVHVWDTTKGKELFGLSKHKAALMSLAISPDGHLLASGDMNGRMCLWDVKRQDLRWTKDLQGLVRVLVFSPDGKRLATYDDGKWIRLWELGTGKELHRWAHPQTAENRLIFSPDGQFLASSDSDKTTRIWSVGTGKELPRLPYGPFCLAFSPSGRILAGGGMKFVDLPDGGTGRVGTIRLLEVASGQEIRSIDNDQQSVGCLAFDSDGRTLASGGMNSTILLWDLTGGKTQPSSPLDAKELDRLWAELGDKAPIAYQSIWKLVATPGQAVRILKARLQPVKPADPLRITRLVADLDSNQFSVREQASKGLEDLAELAEPALRKVSEGQPSAEVSRRVELIMQKLNAPVTASDRLRSLRAIEVLERIGTAEAREVLQTIAQGDPGSRLTSEARKTLERLKRKE